jgi:hypothetical protein
VIIEDKEGNKYSVTLHQFDKVRLSTAREYNQKDRIEVHTPSTFDATFVTEPVYGDFPDVEIQFDKAANSVKPSNWCSVVAHTVKGEYPEIDQAWKKYNRAIVKMWKNIALDVFYQLENDQFLSDMYWSNKAGCNCGCSPAFITKSNNHRDYAIELVRI